MTTLTLVLFLVGLLLCGVGTQFFCTVFHDALESRTFLNDRCVVNERLAVIAAFLSCAGIFLLCAGLVSHFFFGA